MVCGRGDGKIQVNMSQEKPIEIRDSRSRQMYRIDDEYLNGYARLCGVHSTCVYNSLCRHSDTNQESYPSIERIADQHGLSRPTVIKAIKKLEEYGIIAVKRGKNPKTKRQNVNIYILVDKSLWKAKPGVISATGSVSDEADLADFSENPGADMTPGSVNDPSKQDLLGAGSISRVEPGKYDDEKPGKPDLLEGNTKRREHIEGSAAQSAPASVCAKEGCKNNAMKGVWFCEQHQEMKCYQFVEWYRRSEQRHIKIIAEWVDELFQNKIAPDLRTVAQWRAWAKPIMTAAKDLSVFDDDQIGAAMKRMMAADYVTDFNLHTLKTFLINTKK